MATQMFFLDTVASTHRGTNNPNLIGTNVVWLPRALGLSRGAGPVNSSATPTVAGTTPGVVLLTSNIATEWISEPVAADVTISGTITANIWAAESNMSANVAINVVIEIIRANALAGTQSSNTIVEIVRSTRITELAVTTNAVNNFTTGMTSGGYTSQTLNRGDRLRILIFGDDAGTMGSGFTFSASFNGNTAAADGDSYVTFTENITFESAPGGTVIYLTDTASDVSTASVDREAWTSRGSSVQGDQTNTVAGFTAPIQTTDTAGGTVVDWFTKQLQAITLSGMAQANIWLAESSTNANTSVRIEIARVDADGSNSTIWGSWCISANNGRTGELATTSTAETAYISGDDLAITDGQRLRIRLYIDDMPALAMGASFLSTMAYNSGSAGVSGDSYITFPVTLAEFTPAAFFETRNPWPWLTAVSRAANW